MFCPQIEKGYAKAFPRKGVSLLTGHALHYAAGPVSLDSGKNLRKGEILLCGDHAVHGSALPEDSGEGPGVYPRNPGNAVLRKELLNGRLAAEVAGKS